MYLISLVPPCAPVRSRVCSFPCFPCVPCILSVSCTIGVPAQYPLPPIVCYFPLCVFLVSPTPLQSHVSVVSLASLVYLVFLVSLVPLVSQPSIPYLLLYVTSLYVFSVSSMHLPSHVSVVSILPLVCLTSFVSPVSHLDLQSLVFQKSAVSPVSLI